MPRPNDMQPKNIVNQDYDCEVTLWDGTKAEDNLQVGASAFVSFDLYNSGATDLYFQVFNDSDAPVNAEVPVFSSPIPSGSGKVIDGRSLFGDSQKFLSTGLSVGISTTAATYTAHATPADVTGSIIYK